jgi:hypothetical protein
VPPLGSLEPGSTESPLPASYVSTGRAPPPVPARSHRSTNTTSRRWSERVLTARSGGCKLQLKSTTLEIYQFWNIHSI